VICILLFKTEIDAEKNITIAGFIMEELGRIARVGDTIVNGELRFYLSRMKKNEIKEIIVEKVQ